jgi:hypothetical protein
MAGWAITDYFPITRLGLTTLGIGIDPDKDARLLDDSYNDPRVLDARAGRYLGNIRMTERIARAYDVLPVFVVQPSPTYKYDVRYHPFAEWGFGRHSQSAYGYPRLAERLRGEHPVDYLIWAADIQENLREPLYVDLVHYSPKLSEIFAAEIARQIDRRSLLEHLPRLSESARPATVRASVVRRDRTAR